MSNPRTIASAMSSFGLGVGSVSEGKGIISGMKEERTRKGVKLSFDKFFVKKQAVP